MVKRQSDAYWDKRAIDRAELAEKKIEPSLADLDRIYKRAEQEITAQINQIYRTYGKSQGLDVEKLLEKLSIEETHAFWLKMRADGNLKYITQNYQARITRLEQIKGDVYSRVRSISNEEAPIQTDAHTQTINDAYNGMAYDTSVGLNANIAFGGLNQKVLDTMLTSDWLGSNYSERIWKNTDLLATTVKDRLGAALLTGQSSQRLVDGLVEDFGVGRSSAKRLLRTETNFFQNEANAQSSEDLGLDRYKYLATLDTRTSQTCRLHDDKIYFFKNRVVGVNFPPLHPYCRSTTRAYLGEEYEPETRRARDANGKSVQVENMSYSEWAKLNQIEEVKPSVAPVPAPPRSKPTANTNVPRMNGVIAGKPMTPEEAVKANPHYSRENHDYSWNCQKTVPTYELRRRGYDLEAGKYDSNSHQFGTNLGVQKLWGVNDLDYRSGAKAIQRPDGTSYLIRKRTVKSEVVAQIKSYPIGARVQMLYGYVGKRTGHTMIFEVVPKSEEFPLGIMFVDPQPMTISKSFSLKGKTNFSMLRIDNKAIESSLVPLFTVRSSKK